MRCNKVSVFTSAGNDLIVGGRMRSSGIVTVAVRVEGSHLVRGKSLTGGLARPLINHRVKSTNMAEQVKVTAKE